MDKYKKQANISEGRLCKLWHTSVKLSTSKQTAKELRTMKERMKAQRIDWKASDNSDGKFIRKHQSLGKSPVWGIGFWEYSKLMEI